MAWSRESVSPRAARLPSDWQARRVRVLRRDGYRCQERDSRGVLCGARANQVDHIVRGDDHDLANLRALCEWHHRQKTAREGAEAAAEKRVSRYRKPEPHPGAIRVE